MPHNRRRCSAEKADIAADGERPVEGFRTDVPRHDEKHGHLRQDPHRPASAAGTEDRKPWPLQGALNSSKYAAGKYQVFRYRKDRGDRQLQAAKYGHGLDRVLGCVSWRSREVW